MSQENNGEKAFKNINLHGLRFLRGQKEKRYVIINLFVGANKRVLSFHSRCISYIDLLLSFKTDSKGKHIDLTIIIIIIGKQI